MDYPAPMAKITNGRINLSDAYGVGIGAFDTFAVKYAYSQFAPGADEAAALSRLVDEATAKGMLFIADSDARPGWRGANPLASLWDNGSDPVANLKHELAVRKITLSTFDVTRIPEGQSLRLPRAEVPPNLLPPPLSGAGDREVTGRAKFYTYAVRKGNAPVPAAPAIVAPDVQRAALAAVLDTLSARQCFAVPERVLALLQPPSEAFGGFNTEMFPRRTGLTFDPVLGRDHRLRHGDLAAAPS